MLVDLATSKCGALILAGGKSSFMRVMFSRMSRAVKYLMLLETETLKVITFKFGRDTMDQIRDGALSIAILKRKHQLKDLTRNSVSTLTDHSTLFLNSQ